MQTFVVTVGKSRLILKKTEDVDQSIDFIVLINKSSEYLKNHTFDRFEQDDTLEDGLYVIKNESSIKVYKLETLTLDGYLYSSTYKTRKVVNQYELIPGEFDKI